MKNIKPRIKNWSSYESSSEKRNPGKKLMKNKVTLGLLKFIISPVKYIFPEEFLSWGWVLIWVVLFKRRTARMNKYEAPNISITLIDCGKACIIFPNPKTTISVCTIKPEQRPRLKNIPFLLPCQGLC